MSISQAQGIVGALAMESSGFMKLQEETPMILGSRGGYGFAQWTGVRRKEYEEFVKNLGLSPDSYEANRAFLFEELKGTESKVIEKLRGVEDPQEVQRIFTDIFLRPGIPHYEHRENWTNKVIENTKK